jgi:hypothetical protein
MNTATLDFGCSLRISAAALHGHAGAAVALPVGLNRLSTPHALRRGIRPARKTAEFQALATARWRRHG